MLRSASRWALRGMVLVAGLAFLAIGIGPHLGLYQTATVLSGSMRPTFSPGDLLVLRPERITEVRVGQVITYAIPIGDHHIESHRVIQVRHVRGNVMVRTKGDANSVRDPWTAVLHGRQAWREVGVVPYAGRGILWLRQPNVHRASVLLAPMLLVLLGLSRIWTRHTATELDPSEATAPIVADEAEPDARIAG